jgi:hypothetical protein
MRSECESRGDYLGNGDKKVAGLATIFAFTLGFESWSGIRESNSRLHLGKVAYYHYTNPANRKVNQILIACGREAEQGFVVRRMSRCQTALSGRTGSAYSWSGTRLRTARGTANGDTRCNGKPEPLIYFEDASRLDDGRFFLPLGKPHGALTVDVDTSEPFAVVVVHGDLPVAVPAPAIFVKPVGLPLGLPLRFLFHGSITLGKCSRLSQVRDPGTSTQLGVNPSIT